ncbi:hypothetical protein ES703_20429 [subsurface metagenome]
MQDGGDNLPVTGDNQDAPCQGDEQGGPHQVLGPFEERIGNIGGRQPAHDTHGDTSDEENGGDLLDVPLIAQHAENQYGHAGGEGQQDQFVFPGHPTEVFHLVGVQIQALLGVLHPGPALFGGGFYPGRVDHHVGNRHAGDHQPAEETIWQPGE